MSSQDRQAALFNFEYESTFDQPGLLRGLLGGLHVDLRLSATGLQWKPHSFSFTYKAAYEPLGQSARISACMDAMGRRITSRRM